MTAEPAIRASFLGVILLLSGGAGVRVGAQVPDSLPIPRAQVQPNLQEADSIEAPVIPGRISPGGAFLRSALVPGWGHAEVGAYARGAFYFAAEGASALMIFKTQTRIDRTRKELALREAVVTARLAAQNITDPLQVESALAEDPVVEDLRALQDTREGQREDWIAFGVFLMLIGGADAYVSAHLADFPTAVVLEPSPTGGMEIGLSLPVNF